MIKVTTLSFILIAVTLLQPSINLAQWIGDIENEAHIQRGIKYVYNLSFDSAQIEFREVTQSKPEHPAGYFFLAMVEWWRIITDFNNKSRDDKFISILDRVIDLCDKRLEKNEDDVIGLFFKGGALGFQGRLYGNREDWLKAANCGRAALPIVQKAYRLEPNNYDILLGIGIYNYYAAVIPEIYPWVKPLMFFVPKGDKLKGIDQLKTTSEKALYANIEATYFLMQVYYSFENRLEEAQPISTKLNRMFPNNVIFHKFVGRCYTSQAKWDEMQIVYLEVLKRVGAQQVGYDVITEREANYYLGLAEMNFRKYDSSLQYFYRADELSRTLDTEGPSGYMALSNLKIGMIYDVQGKRNLAIVQYNKVLDMKDYQNTHEQAEKYLKSSYKNN